MSLWWDSDDSLRFEPCRCVLLRAPALCLTHRCNDRSPKFAISTRQRPFHAFGTPGRQTSRDDDPRGSGGMGGFAASPGRLFVGEPLGKGPAPSPRRLAAASAGKNVSRGLRWERDTPAASGTFLLRLLAPLGSQSQARPRQFPRKQTGGTTRLVTLSVVPCRPLGAPRGERLCSSNPASLALPQRRCQRQRSTAPQVGQAAQRGRTRARRARLGESTSCGEGFAISVEAAPRLCRPSRAFQAAGRTGSGKATWRRSAIRSLSSRIRDRACAERVRWQQLEVAALAWVGPDMRGSTRAGFCGLAVLKAPRSSD